ncbi:BN159_2729 family protein [Streptomyces sp. NPDC088354]|uniref:BN159_2729 family protein n=1 Tax=Streptomyces sp. NPDC088354 TaxID=3365856 RepID=UPI0038108A78
MSIHPATELIRTGVAPYAGDQADEAAAAIARILDKAGCLTTAKDAAGVGPALLPVEAVPPALEAATAPATLEAEALDWDAACARAAYLADHFRSSYANRDDVTSVEHDGNRVVMTLAVNDLRHWFGWLTPFKADSELYFERPGGLMAVADGVWASIAVRIQSPDTADLVTAAADTAIRPVWAGNRLYDLAQQLVDATGAVWEYAGKDDTDGVPLVAQAGTGKEGRLDAAARAYGITPYLGEQPEDTPEAEAEATDEPEPDEGTELTPAGELALRLGDMPHAAGIDAFAVMAPTALTLTVRPETAESWAWWLDLFGIPYDRITRDDTTASGTGERDGVTVALTGLDAAALALGGADDE